MYRIASLTSDYKQKTYVVLDNGTSVTLSLYFYENQRAWFFSFEYNNKTYGIYRLTNCPNILREYQNVLPFGIGCSVSDGYEPFMLDDFVSGRASVYVLNKEEVNLVGKEMYGKIW